MSSKLGFGGFEIRDGEEIIHTERANRTQEEGRAVGGKLALTSERLLFQPTKMDEHTGGRSFEIELDDITEVGSLERGSGSLKDTVFGGGLRERLRVVLTNDRQELFVVSDLDTVSERIERTAGLRQQQNERYCPSCGNPVTSSAEFCSSCGEHQQNIGNQNEIESPSTGDQGSQKRKITISKGLAYFFGGGGLVAGPLLMATGSVVAGALIVIAGVIGFPRTRRRIEDRANIEVSKWIATFMFLFFWLTGSFLLG